MVAAGEQLGNYRLGQRLGEGAMGVVFAAEHVVLRKRAAVKVLQPALAEDVDLLERFFREARATAAIHHPGIVDIYDFGYHQGAPYIVMELLHGESLRTRLRGRNAVSLAHAATFGRQIANALVAVHELGIIHRDLKPDNLFLVPDTDLPGGQRIKVLDFGIAKLHSSLSIGDGLTAVGSAMGTALYMSPEQCRGAADLDHRCDIYALGCILFELLAGRPPFSGESMLQLIEQHLHAPVPSVRLQCPHVPAAFDELLVRMLAKRPQDRPATMRDVATALDAFGEGRSSALAFASTLPSNGEPRRVSGEAAPVGAIVSRTAVTASTTLGGAASQGVDVVAPARSRRGLWIALALGLGGVSAVMIVVTRDRGQSSLVAPAAKDPRPDIDRPPALDAAVAEIVAFDALPVSADAVTEVALRIESVPRGAAVIDEHGKLVGHTPVTVRRPLAAGIARFVVKLDGRKATVELPLDRDGTAVAKLVSRKPRDLPDKPLDLDDKALPPP